MVRTAALWLGTIVILSGCLALDSVPKGPPPDPSAALPRLALGEAAVEGTDPLVWNGSLSEGQVEARLVQAVIPAEFAATGPFDLEVSVLWEWLADLDFDLEVRDAYGNLLATGIEPHAGIGVQRVNAIPVPGSAAVVLLPQAESGSYEISVRATKGSGPYQGVVQVEPRPGQADAPRDLLPNLVTLRPLDLAIRDPNGMRAPAGIQGCSPEETAESGVTRCLRFSNGIGNTGEGALEMRLAIDEGTNSFTTQGHFVQRIARSDGSFEDRPVGEASFHPVHAHFHYAGTAQFAVYDYDEAAQERGELLTKSRKTGFCFADLSLVEIGLPYTRTPAFDASGCWDPLVHNVWITGLQPNWYDRYHWTWFEQYVPLDGVPDGVYELVSVSNVEGTIIETDTTDNEASVLFQLSGDEVEDLGPPGSADAK